MKRCNTAMSVLVTSHHIKPLQSLTSVFQSWRSFFVSVSQRFPNNRPTNFPLLYSFVCISRASIQCDATRDVQTFTVFRIASDQRRTANRYCPSTASLSFRHTSSPTIELFVFGGYCIGKTKRHNAGTAKLSAGLVGSGRGIGPKCLCSVGWVG